ncbi:MAG: hypothetical protein RR425_04885, partial [Erysipelotrichales bacterium]
MEQNNKNDLRARNLRKAVGSASAFFGYVAGSIIIGIYLDQKFFNKTGTAVVVSAVIGIVLV